MLVITRILIFIKEKKRKERERERERERIQSKKKKFLFCINTNERFYYNESGIEEKEANALFIVYI
jgi:hypothetical protein